MSLNIQNAPSFELRYPRLSAFWTPEWTAQRARLLAEAFTSPTVQAALAAGDPLPAGFGQAMDERVVELPWAFAADARGKLLDAGSALNHADVLGHFAPAVSDLHIVTLEPEAQAFTQARISYVFADLRELPYRDDLFDTVVSISTLEHVGMNNERYGVDGLEGEAPDRELALALGELKRVTRAGGTLLLTVPYGRPDDLGWFRVFDRRAVERIVDVVDPTSSEISVYRYDPSGWQLSDLDAAADAVYRDHEKDPTPADLAPNARAVACLRLGV
jgi:SAM-dependent methyltransferase